MAFFARLIPTAIQGAGWLIKNSGNFKDIYNTIRKVTNSTAITIADGQTLEEALMVEIAGFGGFFPALSTGLKVAEGILGGLVGGFFGAGVLEDEDNGHFVLATTPIDLPALWPNPDTSKGKSVPAISGDLNKHFAAHNIPVTFIKDGKEANLGDEIAKQMFQLPVQPAKPGIKPAAMRLKNIDLGNDGRLRSAVAAYPIPLGNKGYNGWHSFLRVYHDKFNGQASTPIERPMTVRFAKSLAENGKPYNITTIQATFNGVTGARDFIIKVCNQLPKDYTLAFEIAEAGNVIAFQVQTPLDIGPGQVQSTVASTAGELQVSATLPSLPDFKITKNQVIVPGATPDD